MPAVRAKDFTPGEPDELKLKDTRSRNSESRSTHRAIPTLRKVRKVETLMTTVSPDARALAPASRPHLAEPKVEVI